MTIFNEKSAEKPIKVWAPSSACFITPKHYNSITSIAEGQTNVIFVDKKSVNIIQSPLKSN